MLKLVQKSKHERDHRAFFVVNPAAGKGKISAIVASINRYFPGDKHEIYMLDSREDIAEVVKEVLKEGFNTIAAAGGDGTVSRVAAALVNSKAELGIVPAGTANMLARELGVPISLEEACSLIASPHQNAILDAMRTNGRHFIYQMVCGYSAMVWARMDPRYKRLLGRSAFLFSGLRHLIDLKPYEFEIEVDGVRYDFTATQVIVANAGILGARPFKLGKGIKPDDGLLDIIVIKGRTAASFVAGGTDLVLGMDGYSKSTVHLTGREIVIRSDDAGLKADGEWIGKTPVKVKVLPGAVRTIIPEGKCQVFSSCGAPIGRSLLRMRFSKSERRRGGDSNSRGVEHHRLSRPAP